MPLGTQTVVPGVHKVPRVCAACLLVIQSWCQYVSFRVHSVWYLVCGGQGTSGMFAGLLSKADAHFYLQIRHVWLVHLLFKLYLLRVPNHKFFVNVTKKEPLLRKHCVPHDFYNFPACVIPELLADLRWGGFSLYL